MENFLMKRFKLRENGTTISTEIMAGITIFMTMSYILAVNPTILGEAGMDPGGVFTATVIASCIGTVLMGLMANYPFALSAGMGLNAFFTYTVVQQMGYSWNFALTAVFIEGILFMLMSLFKFREAIFDAIPPNLKKAVSAGIGLFITIIGLSSAGIVVQGEGVILSVGDLSSPEVLVTIVGILLVGIMLHYRVRGAILFGIVAATILAIILGVTKLPTSLVSAPPSLSQVAFKLDFKNIFSLDMLVVVFTFLFVDVFDTVGTLIGVANQADMLDEDGSLERPGPALMADAIATTIGALLGTSTVKAFVESASGVAQGGRTGLTAIATAAMFALSLFFYPIFEIIPAAATAPALIIVGLMMMTSVKDIDLGDYTEAIPAFLTIVMMPFGYSIAEGIVFGIVSYVVLKLLTGKVKEVSPLMVFFAILFLARIIFM